MDAGRSGSIRVQVIASVAAEAFGRFGVDFAAARRAGGRTNATWIGGGLAVRVAGAPGSADLLREAELSALLPAEVGYPRVIEAGVMHGFQWIATEQIDAVNLDEMWAELDWDDRVLAWRQLWERARAVHRVDLAAAAHLARPRSPFYSQSHIEARTGLERLRAAGVLRESEVRRLDTALHRHWAALPRATKVLNHGDLSPVNGLWDGKSVVSLLDFEFAVVAPVQLDLNELVKHAFAPPEFGTPLIDADIAGRRRLQETVIGLAEPMVRTATDVALLIGHSIQLETWLTERELAKRGPTAPFERWESYRVLTAFADEDGGCFAPLLASLT